MSWSTADEETGILFRYDSLWQSLLSKYRKPDGITNLPPQEVMDFFSLSGFYDKSCNNEVLKMQRQTADKLIEMTGVEYQIVSAREPILYVLRKQHRSAPDHVSFLATYYIVNGVVYPASSVQAVLNARLSTSLFHLKKAVNLLRERVKFTPSKQHTYDFDTKPTSQPVAPPLLRSQTDRNNRVLELVSKIPNAIATVEEQKNSTISTLDPTTITRVAPSPYMSISRTSDYTDPNTMGYQPYSQTQPNFAATANSTSAAAPAAITPRTKRARAEAASTPKKKQKS